MTQQFVSPRWIAFNVDIGAGGTVWPMNADYACEKISGLAGRNYTTQQVKWSKNKDVFVFDAKAPGDTNCT